ncbi:hypothetical protein [Corynebacterium sp.]|uniref:hypothetical protein n=1 Tax=Corynebacterium sp. TaxID=1720 RepID=UPI003B3A8CE4
MVTLFGGWLVWQSRKNDTNNSREGRIEARMDLLEKKLDRVQSYLRAEQRFYHRLVLAVQTVTAIAGFFQGAIALVTGSITGGAA